MYLIWSFHVGFSSRKIPKNFIDSDRLISLLHIHSLWRTKRILSFLLGLWKNEYFVFVTFRDDLLERNHWPIFCNSMLTVSNNAFVFSSGWNKLSSMDIMLSANIMSSVSSTNKKGSNKFQVYCRSFIYIYMKNKRGANIDRRGTSHTTSFKSVFLILLIWIYYFLFVALSNNFQTILVKFLLCHVFPFFVIVFCGQLYQKLLLDQ